MPIVLFRQLEHCLCFRVIEESGVRITPAALGAKSLQGLELPFELVLLPLIIGVQESDPLASRFLDSPVPRRTRTLIGLGVVADAIAKGLTQDLSCAIRRPVIDDDNFDVGEGLVHNAFNRALDLACPVIGRDYYRYFVFHA